VQPPVEPSRILQVVADGSPGGGTTHVLQLLRWLRPSQEVGLVTQPGSFLAGAAEGHGVRVYGADLLDAASVLTHSRTLARIIRQFRPDLVHVHGGRAAAFVAFAGLLAPSIYTVHGFHFLQQPWPLRHARFAIERRTMRSFDAVVFVSDHDRRVALLRRLPAAGQPCHVVHNGIRLFETGQPDQKKPAAIGFVGRLEYQKNPLLFLEVAARLPGQPAILVGDGRLAPRVHAHVEESGLQHVVLLGAKSHEEVLRILGDMSVLVMTSRWEGLPLVAIEAMWAGVPVVATKVGGVGEVIEDGVSGLLVDSRDPQTIADAVRRLLGDPALRDRIIKNARERVRTSFSEERMLSDLGRVYDSVLRKPPQSLTL